ncbi:c-type cytochrome [Azohydromonas aeria]|uniref:c-type cytochrome n=1 Tax=Azohydromonas aeria TaxID=2590212 RepID=UPI00217540F7|nr:c-type cytochrome [Azohydromonas aeria]
MPNGSWAKRFAVTAWALCSLGANARVQDGGPASSAHLEQGRQLFQAHCARCHGADARGGGGAPNLLQRVAGMSEDRFASAVLRRYAWSIDASEAASPDAVREALLRGTLQQRTSAADMPAWESNAVVRQGIAPLYRYLDTQARQAAR